MKKSLSLCISLFLLLLANLSFAQAPSYASLDVFQNTKSREYVEQRINSILLKHEQIRAHFEITDTSLKMYSSKENKAKNQPEFILNFGNDSLIKLPSFRADTTSAYPLRGLRVALDPGHLGGDFARREARYIDMRDIEGVQFNEGTLAYLTAVRLKELLVAKGAEVLITRDGIGVSSMGLTYEEWFESEVEATVEEEVSSIENEEQRQGAADWWLSEKEKNTFKWMKKLFTNQDYRTRARKINSFRPHLTLIIHFNAGNPEKVSGQDLTTSENYHMAFVPGSFMKNELKTKENRINFVRLILKDDIETSTAFSSVVLDRLAADTDIEIAQSQERLDYLEGKNYLRTSCLPTDAPGVYLRNLALTRTIKGTLCYAESFCQDNEEECLRLNDKSIEIDGVKTSARVGQVAESYFNAILQYTSQ